MRAWFEKNKKKVLIAAAVVIVLVAAYWFGGSAPGMQGWSVSKASASPSGVSLSAVSPSPLASAEPSPSPAAETVSPSPSAAAKGGSGGIETRPGGAENEKMTAAEKEKAAAKFGGNTAQVENGDADYSAGAGMQLDPATGKDQYLTNPVPAGKPVPVEPQNAVITDKQSICTISISCSTINDNIGWLDPEKKELVPSDGWLLKPTQVTFYEGESVFNVLQRTCKQQGIHMEFKNTPIYNSAYIEGIGNLYEFDCGELSGWMYKVNSWFPNYGCSRYQLHEGDKIEWVYTCNLGVDVGGYAAATS